MNSEEKRASTSRRLYRGAGVATFAVFAVIAVAGCGDDDDSSDEGASASSAEATDTAAAEGAGGAQSVSVSETEYALDPSDPTVKAGSVTFDVANDGQIVHTLEVEGPNGEQELEPDLQPGDSGKLTVDLSEPGTYEFYCPIGSHKDQGMEGEITVTG